MTTLQSTVHDLTEHAAEQLNPESHNEKVVASQQGNTTATLMNRSRLLLNAKLEEYKKKALEGDVDAQLFLGAHFHELEDMEQAAFFYKLAADQGNRFGILGLAYNTDTDDDLESFQLFMKAAILGDPDAQFRISLEFLQGAPYTAVPKDQEVGFTWLEKAANNGHCGAQYYMGSMYRKGIWVEQSDMKAFQWFERAAVNGHPVAQFSLGNYYEDDLVGKKDMTAAYDWKLKAAHQGYIEVDGELRCHSCNKNENVSAVDMFGGPY